jgi:hypothetical protein
MDNFDSLEKAIDLFRSGDVAAASRILARQVTQEPKNDQAWLWLAACLDPSDKQDFCLKKAQDLNPANPATWRELRRYLSLDRPVREPGSPINLPPPPEPVWPAASADEPTDQLPRLEPEKKVLSRTQMIILLLLVLVILVIIVAMAYMIFVNPSELPPFLQRLIGGGGLVLPPGM